MRDHHTATVTSPSIRSRAPIVIAGVLGLAGIGAIVSGVALLASSADASPAASVALSTIAPQATTSVPGVTTSTPVEPVGFIDLVDETGVLAISVPAGWLDIDSTSWVSDGIEIGPSVSAATDRIAWISGWGTPGVFVGATDQIAAEEAFGDFSDDCDLESTAPIAAAGLNGSGEWWTDCGAEGSDFFVGVLRAAGSDIIVIQIVAIDGDITGLVARLLTTLRYDGSR